MASLTEYFFKFLSQKPCLGDTTYYEPGRKDAGQSGRDHLDCPKKRIKRIIRILRVAQIAQQLFYMHRTLWCLMASGFAGVIVPRRLLDSKTIAARSVEFAAEIIKLSEQAFAERRDIEGIELQAETEAAALTITIKDSMQSFQCYMRRVRRALWPQQEIDIQATPRKLTSS
jgi:hypothetical protein